MLDCLQTWQISNVPQLKVAIDVDAAQHWGLIDQQHSSDLWWMPLQFSNLRYFQVFRVYLENRNIGCEAGHNEHLIFQREKKLMDAGLAHVDRELVIPAIWFPERYAILRGWDG